MDKPMWIATGHTQDLIEQLQELQAQQIEAFKCGRLRGDTVQDSVYNMAHAQGILAAVETTLEYIKRGNTNYERATERY